jgi:hypothetical protein
MKIRFSYPVRAPQADVKSAQTQVSAFCPDMSIYSRLQVARHNPDRPLLHHDSPTEAPSGKIARPVICSNAIALSVAVMCIDVE